MLNNAIFNNDFYNSKELHQRLNANLFDLLPDVKSDKLMSLHIKYAFYSNGFDLCASDAQADVQIAVVVRFFVSPSGAKNEKTQSPY